MKTSLKPMFLTAWAVLATWVVGSNNGMGAEAPRGVEELTRLTVVSARLMGEAKAHVIAGKYGFWGGSHCLFGTAIRPNDSQEVTVHLTAGGEYRLIAAGDSNALDLDLFVLDPSGKQIAKDDRVAASATVSFRATQDGRHTFRLRLYNGRATSFCALVVLERNGGYDIPFANLAVAMNNYVKVAGASALLVNQAANGRADVRLDNGSSGWCLFGSVMNQDDKRTMSKLNLGDGEHLFLAVGCARATDIDLVVTNQREVVIVEDFDLDAHPMGLGTTRRNDTYEFDTLLPESDGPALVLSGVLKVEIAPNQGIRPLGGW